MKACSKARRRLKKLPKAIRDYLLDLDKKCQNYNVKLILSAGQSVNFGGGRCGGYFDDGGKILKVAIGGSVESILSVSLHEESHLDQWQNPKSIWHDYKTYNGYNRFCHYLNGKNIYKKDQALAATVALERECERFAIKKIKAKWLKYINLDRYSANSNAYLFSYLHMAETRKWPSNTPCTKRFRAHCHTKLLKSHKKMPAGLKEAFVKYL